MTTRISAIAAAAALLVSVYAGSAQAQINNRNFYVGAGLGFGVTFDGGQAYFRGEENIGYHVLNVGQHPGLYVGLALSQGVGRAVSVQFAGKLGFDIAVWTNGDMALLIDPSLQTGVAILVSQGEAYPAFYMNPGLEVSFALARGLVDIFWRPVGFDILIRDGGFAAYSMMFGANFNF